MMKMMRVLRRTVTRYYLDMIGEIVGIGDVCPCFGDSLPVALYKNSFEVVASGAVHCLLCFNLFLSFSPFLHIDGLRHVYSTYSWDSRFRHGSMTGLYGLDLGWCVGGLPFRRSTVFEEQ